MPPVPDPRLRQAFADGDLALYLGAGASMASGLPSWEKLILSMYFGAITEQSVGRPFSNYLYAIAEWHLRNVRQPAEVVARKVRMIYADPPDEFAGWIKELLYASKPGTDAQSVREGNATLAAIAELCEASSRSPVQGVEAVISYNYDDLLETALGDRCVPVWDASQPVADAIPIFHVHGYLPRDATGSRYEDILLTEEQYHRAAHDVYSWSNLVQIRYLTSTVGLMVGLSLTDQNMRRLLDAIAHAELRAPTYALLQRPTPTELDDHALTEIHARATSLYDRFQLGDPGGDYGLIPGIKGGDWRSQVQAIVNRVEEAEAELNQQLLGQLGVDVVWYDEHDEVAEFLRAIAGGG